MQLIKKPAINKPKYKSYTPITIAIPKAQQELIKAIPHRSFQAFQDKTHTPTDWYNLCFRIRIGYDLAVAYYTQEAVDALKQALDAILAIKTTYVATKLLEMPEELSEGIKDGLDYTDQMCDENTRRAQLDAFHESDRYMKKLIQEINPPTHQDHHHAKPGSRARA